MEGKLPCASDQNTHPKSNSFFINSLGLVPERQLKKLAHLHNKRPQSFIILHHHHHHICPPFHISMAQQQQQQEYCQSHNGPFSPLRDPNHRKIGRSDFICGPCDLALQDDGYLPDRWFDIPYIKDRQWEPYLRAATKKAVTHWFECPRCRRGPSPKLDELRAPVGVCAHCGHLDDLQDCDRLTGEEWLCGFCGTDRKIRPLYTHRLLPDDPNGGIF